MTRFSQSAAQRADRPDESQRLASWYTPGLSDAIGDRLLMFDNSTSSSLELLRFRPEFGKAPGFEDALRRRVEELANFTHPAIAKIRAVESLGDEDGLALISNHTVGRRLSEVQQVAHGPQFATELIAQIVPILAALQEQGQGMAHGLLTPERVTVTPDGRLVLSEHVLGSAIDALRLSPARLRDQLGLMMAPGASSVDDPRADIVQLGYLAVSLLVGRKVHSLDAAREIVGKLRRQALSDGREAPLYLQRWLGRALEVDGAPFESANDAEHALTEWPESELESDDPLPREVPAPKPAVEQAPRAVVAQAPQPEPIIVGSLLGLRTPAPKPVVPEPAVAAPKTPRQDDLKVGHSMLDAIRKAPEWPKPIERPQAQAEPAHFGLGLRPAVEPAFLRNTEPAVVTSAVPRAALPIGRWLVAALAFICLVESMIIAGLLASRAHTANAAAVTPAPSTSAQPLTSSTPAPPTAHNTATPAARAGTVAPKSSAAAPAAAVVVPAPAPPRGWVTIDSPVDLQVFAGRTLVGRSGARIALPSGQHDLRLVSASLAFETAVRVDVPAGRGMTTQITPPNGTLSLNALPWANVTLDGQSLGTTPFANLSVPVGTHEIIWRHPQLGERRQTVVLTTKTPVRLVVDLRR